MEYTYSSGADKQNFNMYDITEKSNNMCCVWFMRARLGYGWVKKSVDRQHETRRLNMSQRCVFEDFFSSLTPI